MASLEKTAALLLVQDTRAHSSAPGMESVTKTRSARALEGIQILLMSLCGQVRVVTPSLAQVELRVKLVLAQAMVRAVMMDTVCALVKMVGRVLDAKQKLVCLDVMDGVFVIIPIQSIQCVIAKKVTSQKTAALCLATGIPFPMSLSQVVMTISHHLMDCVARTGLAFAPLVLLVSFVKNQRVVLVALWTSA
jgi:hypothetical protein